jgi:hypothetical protein
MELTGVFERVGLVLDWFSGMDWIDIGLNKRLGSVESFFPRGRDVLVHRMAALGNRSERSKARWEAELSSTTNSHNIVIDTNNLFLRPPRQLLRPGISDIPYKKQGSRPHIGYAMSSLLPRFQHHPQGFGSVPRMTSRSAQLS